MAQGFTGTIDVGGIKYTFDKKKKGVNYLFRNYEQFRETFQSVSERSGIPLDQIKQLFIKYFRVKPFDKQDFAAILQPDKDNLIKIFKAYLIFLENSKAMSGDTVFSIMLNRTFYEISNILIELNGTPKKATLSEACQASKKKLIDLTSDIRTKMITEFTWLLQNPNEIRSDNECKWAEAVAGLTEIRLTDMAAHVSATKHMEKKTKGGGIDAMKHRLRSLLMVSTILDAAKKHGYDQEEGYQDLQQSLSKAILPLYKEIKKALKMQENIDRNKESLKERKAS